jgi:phosphopantetheinyl transferase
MMNRNRNAAPDTPQGKPQLDWPVQPPAFNWSRSGDLFLFGLSEAGELGVDAACHEVNVDCLGVAQSHFPAHVTAQLEAAPQPERPRWFFQHWTRFEAYAKAVGCGIAAGQARQAWTETPQVAYWQREFQLAFGPASVTLAWVIA